MCAFLLEGPVHSFSLGAGQATPWLGHSLYTKAGGCTSSSLSATPHARLSPPPPPRYAGRKLDHPAKLWLQPAFCGRANGEGSARAFCVEALHDQHQARCF